MPGSYEILVIVLLVLVLFGPDKMPELVRQVGRFIRKINRMRNDVMRQVNFNLGDDDD